MNKFEFSFFLFYLLQALTVAPDDETDLLHPASPSQMVDTPEDEGTLS